MWKNVEVLKEKADKFKDFLRDNCIRFESSEAWNYIHFELNVTCGEELLCNKFLDSL